MSQNESGTYFGIEVAGVGTISNEFAEENGKAETTLRETGEFQTRVYHTSSINSSIIRKNSIRFSKRKRPENYSIHSASRSEADDILRTGDAVRLTWKNVNVTAVPEVGLITKLRRKKAAQTQAEIGKRILQNINGVAEPGSLLAIMGSSGAGKSTLLNVLTWRNRQNLKIEGEIKVNGQELQQHITNISAYVQQDDLFLGALTVREHLMFSAKLRLDQSLTEKDRIRRVEEVMDQMGLRKCENTAIGTPGKTKTISGGEMKRLSFAAELLTNPPLMFCDEPTSGLDSYLAKVLCECLQSVAKQGCTVLCTIHQPSSEVFSLFDQLLLLSLGKVIYMGPRSEAVDYFSRYGIPCPINYNPADHYIMSVSVIPGDEERCKQKIAEFAEHYENSIERDRVGKLVDETIDNTYAPQEASFSTSPYKVGFFSQFMACLSRAYITIYRDPSISRVRLGQTVVVALIVGLIYLRTPYGKAYSCEEVRNISGALFLVAINLTFSYVFGVINVFPTEVPIFRREHFNGMYSTAAYFFSKNLAELPMYIVYPLIYVVIVYFMFGLYPAAANFFVFFGICILMVNTCVSFGYLISCISPTVTIALAIGPPLMMPLLLFGGFFLAADSIPSYFVWLKYLSWFLYTNEMLTVNQWRGVVFVEAENVTLYPNSTCRLSTGEDVITAFDFNENYMYRDVGIMFALLIGYRLIAFFVLLYRMRDSTR